MPRVVDLEHVKPYADHLGDGIVQFSFTLPVPYGLAARKAAQELARKMGFEHPEVVHYQGLTDGYTYFVMFGECTQTVDYATLSDEGFEIEYMSEDQIEAFAQEQIGRPIVIVGAATGTDTHSVGIDAMLNLKGFHGHHGLEGYKAFRDAQPRQPGPQQRARRARDRAERRRDPRLADRDPAEPARLQPDRARRDRRSGGQAHGDDPHLRRPAGVERAREGARLRRRLLEGHLPATTWRASSCASWPRARRPRSAVGTDRPGAATGAGRAGEEHRQDRDAGRDPAGAGGAGRHASG